MASQITLDTGNSTITCQGRDWVLDPLWLEGLLQGMGECEADMARGMARSTVSFYGQDTAILHLTHKWGLITLVNTRCNCDGSKPLGRIILCLSTPEIRWE